MSTRDDIEQILDQILGKRFRISSCFCPRVAISLRPESLGKQPMRIAQIAPLWERVPPKNYGGGAELVVSLLTDELGASWS